MDFSERFKQSSDEMQLTEDERYAVQDIAEEIVSLLINSRSVFSTSFESRIRTIKASIKIALDAINEGEAIEKERVASTISTEKLLRAARGALSHCTKPTDPAKAS